MKPLQITQKEYNTLNGIGGWLILLAIRVVSGPVIGTLLIVLYRAGLTRNPDGFTALFAPGNWQSLLILAALLAYEIVCAVFFFLKHRKFVLLYAILAVFTAAMLIVAGILNPLGISTFSLASFSWDIIFVAYLFRSKRGAITFKTRKLEIIRQDWVDLEDNKNIFGTSRPLGIILVICFVAGGIIFNNLAQRNVWNSTSNVWHTVSPEETRDSAISPRPEAITPVPSVSFAPTPSPAPTNNKYDVLRLKEPAPSGGDPLDPLRLLEEPSCLGENVSYVISNMDESEYSRPENAESIYQFYPKFDYLGLGWMKNWVRLDTANGIITTVWYNTESVEFEDTSAFLSIVDEKFKLLTEKYGDPVNVGFIENGKSPSSPSYEEMMDSLKDGNKGYCSILWEETDLIVILDFRNEYKGAYCYFSVVFKDRS